MVYFIDKAKHTEINHTCTQVTKRHQLLVSLSCTVTHTVLHKKFSSVSSHTLMSIIEWHPKYFKMVHEEHQNDG